MNPTHIIVRLKFPLRITFFPISHLKKNTYVGYQHMDSLHPYLNHSWLCRRLMILLDSFLISLKTSSKNITESQKWFFELLKSSNNYLSPTQIHHSQKVPSYKYWSKAPSLPHSIPETYFLFPTSFFLSSIDQTQLHLTCWLLKPLWPSASWSSGQRDFSLFHLLTTFLPTPLTSARWIIQDYFQRTTLKIIFFYSSFSDTLTGTWKALLSSN